MAASVTICRRKPHRPLRKLWSTLGPILIEHGRRSPFDQSLKTATNNRRQPYTYCGSARSDLKFNWFGIGVNFIADRAAQGQRGSAVKALAVRFSAKINF